MPTPQDYGLNHDTWRPGQKEMIEWAYGRMAADKMTGICEAVTGTGKTTLPRALSHKHQTIALVRTKSLQADNYDAGYGFIPLYGRANYDCVHPDADEGMKADDCLYAETGMINCEHGKSAMQKVWTFKEYEGKPAEYFAERFEPCPYVLARESAKAARRSVLNYPYWFHSYSKWPTPDALVCDEGHQLSDETLDWAGCTISEEVRVKWGMKPFPMIRGGAGGLLTKVEPATDRAVAWLEQSIVMLRAVYSALSEKSKTDDQARKRSRQVELLGKKLGATCEALKHVPEDWYIKSGPGVLNGKSGFIARPLTAKHHFGRYFLGDWRLFIMSATIGNPQVFAEELGLKEYDHYLVPSIYTAEERPVMALDVPKMGRGIGDKERNKQADEIAGAIGQCPPDWSGIIHVTSKMDAPLLADRLARRGLQDRVWVSPQGLGTDGMAAAWHNRRRRFPGSLNINWAMWEGYDGREEKISIVAKCPFPSLGDEYEVARQHYNMKMYLQRTAWKAEQGCGRSRRGRAEDYDTPDERRGLVAIADGSYRMIQKYFSESFRQAIVKN